MLTRVLTLASLSLLSLSAATYRGAVPTEDSTFSLDTVHFGIVVSDIDAAATFYGDILGLKELDPFSVPASLCSDAGLTDDHPLEVRVFATTADNDKATNVKLMQLPGVKSKASDNAFIHSQLGISYLTFFVKDLSASMRRVEQAGGKALAQGPVALGDAATSPHLALVRDPDGNLIELIGPKL